MLPPNSACLRRQCSAVIHFSTLFPLQRTSRYTCTGKRSVQHREGSVMESPKSPSMLAGPQWATLMAKSGDSSAAAVAGSTSLWQLIHHNGPKPDKAARELSSRHNIVCEFTATILAAAPTSMLLMSCRPHSGSQGLTRTWAGQHACAP